MNCRPYSTPNPRRTWGWLKAGLFGAALALFGTAQAQNVNVTATAGTLSASYATLNAAFAAINAGTHQGAITCTVVANTTEPAPATPLLRSFAPSSYTSITVNCTGNVTVNSAATPTASRGIIELVGADNVTIDGDDPGTGGTRNLTFQMATTTNSGTQCIRLASNSTTGLDGADNNTVKNCNIIGGRSSATTTTTSWGILMSNSTASTGGAYSSLNTIIDNNAITRCYTGIGAIGVSATYLNAGTIIRNNVLGSATSADNIGSRGINISYSASTAGVGSALIQNNDIRGGDYSTTGYSASVAGIEIGTVNAGCIVERNNIHDVYQQNSGGYHALGIFITGSTSNSGVTIRNNFIRDMVSSLYTTSVTTTGDTYGIYFSAGATNVNIDHNTIRLTINPTVGSTPNHINACVAASVSGVTIASFRNNILVNTLNSTNAYGLYCAATTNISGGTVNNNDYWVPTGKVGYYNAVAQTTLANWQSATGKDGAAININAPVVSATDLHIQTSPAATALPFYQTGATGTGVTNDYDNAARATPPCIGADEFVLPTCSTATATISGSASACVGAANLLTANGPNGLGLTYQWRYGAPGGPYSTNLGTSSTQSTASIPAGNYEVVVDVTCSYCGGCSAPTTSAPYAVTINALPSVAVAPPSGSYCYNSTAVGLTASGASTYTWAPASGLSATTGTSVTAAPGTTTTYTATGTDGNGCVSTGTASITVPASAFIVGAATATPNPTCFNGNSALNVTANTTTSYAVASTTYGLKAGTPTAVTLTDDDATGAIAMPFGFSFNGVVYSSLYIHSNGFVSFSAGNTLGSPYLETIPTAAAPNNYIAICHDDLNVTGGASVGYFTFGSAPNRVFVINWSAVKFYNSASNNGDMSGQIQLYEADAHIEIHVTSSNDPTASAHVIGLENAGGTAGTAAPGRNNVTYSFTSSTPEAWSFTPNGVGSFTYDWSANPSFLSATNVANPSVTGINTASELYSVNVSDGSCSYTRTVTLSTTPPITAATITGTLSFCAGGSTTLTAVPTDGAGPYSYLWSPGGQTTASINVTAAGSYSCQVTDNCGGNVNTGSVSVTVNALPSVSVSPNPGNIWTSGSLSFSNTGGVGTDNVSASCVLTRAASGPIYNSACQSAPGGGLGCAYTGPCNTEWAVGSIANWNTLTYAPLYSANGCAPFTMVGQTWVCHVISENIYFEVQWTGYNSGNYAYTRTTGAASSSYCTGYAAIALTASGASTYAWSPAAGLSATTGASVNASPSATTTYTVTGTDANGCVNTNTTAISVLGAMPVITSTTSVSPVCPGSGSQLQVNIPGPSGYCNSAFTNVTYEFLTNVTFAGINNTSGANTGGPVDYTAQVASVTAGSAYNLDVTMDPDANDYIYAWFDWNQNGVFTDLGEAFTVVANVGTAGPHTVSIPVPAGAINGNTRMRVMVDWNNATPNPCRSATYGEAEDYTVNVTGGVSAYSYSWAPSGDLNDATIYNPTATIPTENTSTTYTVTVTNAAGCVAQGTANVTTPLVNDGDPCTLDACASGVASHTFQDADSDGICDANDPCPNLANLVNGDPCDDGDACTIGDVVAGCVCAGTFQDTDSDGVCDANDPCPTLANVVPGDPCTDGDACTINDVYTALCVCAGTFQDTDSDGICDANDPCPTLANIVPGDPCDDSNVCTINDVYTAGCVCAGTFQDTDSDGVCDANDPCPTLPNIVPGDPCDDSNVCTINDVYTAGCVCAGTFQDTDSDGVCDANDPCPTLANIVPGDPCDDSNVCTINDVYTAGCVCAGTFQDTDSDGICDANDNCPTVPGVQGDPCDDGNANTTLDAIDANCVCVGQPVDCLGVPNGTDLPGTPCDDANVCTINDTWSVACVCTGTFQDTDSDGVCDANDPCPTLANLVNGDPCNDGNVCTINDVVAGCVCAGTFQDTDSDGVCDANDPCPTLANIVPGDPCDDSNVCTINDVYTAGCVCAGTFQDTDSDGVCDANDPCPTLANIVPGDPCDDSNVCTINDVYTAGCVCAGTFQDTDSDGVCDANDPCPTLANIVPGDPCDDGNVCTINDVYTAGCVCAGTFQDTDSDGICDANDNCPTLAGQQGDACTDGDPCTINDVISALCVCAGTPDPVVAGVAPTSAVYCTPGPGIVLTASGGVSYSWAPAAGLSATTGNPVTATPASATTYTVTVTNAAGCTGTASASITTGATPATPTMSGTPNPVCPGSNSQLAAIIGPSFTYCVPSLSNGCSFPDAITQVTVGGIVRGTGVASSSCDNLSGSNGYSNFATPTGALVAGSSGNSYSISTGGDVEGAALWIDYDQNGTFDNPAELIFNSYAGTNPATYTGTFTVPAGAINGNTRLRVRCTYAGAPGTSACTGTQTTYGETEDYTVMISGGVDNCAAGINFSWSPTTYLSNPLVCNPMATAVMGSTTYTVTATNAAGCSSTNTLALNVETADADLDGTVDCLDGCPNDPNKIAPGQCGCGNPDTDTDSDGTADCNDGCVNDPNKIAPGVCGCGVADTDTDSDGTADCIDSCPTDPNKIVPGQCGCGIADTDTDSDGIADCNDNCPNVPGVVGTPCNDGNVNTINDQIDVNCVCVGTTPNCAFNTVLLDLVTDNNGGQTSWDVVNIGTTTVVCSGSGYLNNQTITLDCCLPNGCYELRVFDSAGDGMANGPIGGYVLRASGAGNKRIIDNSGDGIFTTTSQIANNLGFCVPIGTDVPVASSCDKNNWVPTDNLQATINSAVTAQFGVNNANSGYQFWFFNPDGGYSRRVLQTHAAPGTVTGPPTNQRCAYLKLSSIVTQPIPFYTNLNIRIRTQVAGVYSEWGPACRFRMDPVCTTTQLTQTANPVISCGATGLTLASTIYCNAVTGATNYQFEFVKSGYLRRITVATRSVGLGFVTNPLQNNNCYQVRVRISYDGGTTYCPFGSICNITIGTATCGSAMPEAPETGISADPAQLSIWPNPNDGSLVNVAFSGFDNTLSTVLVEVTDVYGKLVSVRTLPVQDGYLKTAMTFEQDLTPGLYLVNLQAGEKRYTERLVIQ